LFLDRQPSGEYKKVTSPAEARRLSMPEDVSFSDFLNRLRAGDEQAAADLVRRFEAVIRCEVRLRMTDPKLGRLFDSMDVCQSVLASFFVRVATGQYDLTRPEDLARLLVRMARNKVRSQARRQKARAADQQRVDAGELDQVRTTGGDPGRVAAERDLLNEVRRRLNAEERQIADMRGQERSWPEIAAAMGGTAEGRRKQLARALERVSQGLGLAEDYDAAS
jgi:RNA polymerase sigma-70 factor (ECF subfamily)